MKNFEELQAKIVDWAEEKDLLHEENAQKQFMKFVEEIFEFKTVFDFKRWRNRKGSIVLNRNLMLEMGDIFVTLIILCKQLKIDPTICLNMAYDKIKDRKGKTINGQFIKEEDL